jgi:hypothetical protein
LGFSTYKPTGWPIKNRHHIGIAAYLVPRLDEGNSTKTLKTIPIKTTIIRAFKNSAVFDGRRFRLVAIMVNIFIGVNHKTLNRFLTMRNRAEKNRGAVYEMADCVRVLLQPVVCLNRLGHRYVPITSNCRG